jgi:hypothetical protein
MTDMQALPRSSTGGYQYCVSCPGEPVLLYVPRGGVRLCGDCLAAATAKADPNEQEEQR